MQLIVDWAFGPTLSERRLIVGASQLQGRQATSGYEPQPRRG